MEPECQIFGHWCQKIRHWVGIFGYIRRRFTFLSEENIVSFEGKVGFLRRKTRLFHNS